MLHVSTEKFQYSLALRYTESQMNLMLIFPRFDLKRMLYWCFVYPFYQNFKVIMSTFLFCIVEKQVSDPDVSKPVNIGVKLQSSKAARKADLAQQRRNRNNKQLEQAARHNTCK